MNREQEIHESTAYKFLMEKLKDAAYTPVTLNVSVVTNESLAKIMQDYADLTLEIALTKLSIKNTL